MIDVVTLIPFYTSDLKDFEKISLKRNLDILSNYDFYFIAPFQLKTNYGFKKIIKEYNAKVMYFDNSFFKGINGYNRLLMQKSFYKNFTKFNYILICQLDALIIEDNLNF